MNLNQYVFGINHSKHKLTLLLSDLLFIAAAFYIASAYRLNMEPNFKSIEYIGINIIIITTLFIGGSYNSSAIASKPKLPLKTFFIVLISVLPSLIFIYSLGPERFTALTGRGIFPFAIISFGVFSVLNRLVINYLFHKGQRTRSVLILGNLNCKNSIEKLLDNKPLKLNYSQKLNPLQHARNNIDVIVICPGHEPDKLEQKTLVEYRLTGVPVFSLIDFIEKFLYLVPIQEVNDRWFIQASGFTMLHNSAALRVKRIVDIFASISLFICSLPITISISILIKTSSPGPVFFSQTRVGMNGKKFTVHKFRTMNTNAETKGAQWASENDSRIIPCGNFLRKTRIDEIPQCWNILKGEMSFIGPRPERPEFTSMLSKEIPYYDLRHVIKPGLTGWAQVKYPYGASTEDSLRKLQFDLYYIKNYSLLLDLNILLRTIKITLMRGGR